GRPQRRRPRPSPSRLSLGVIAEVKKASAERSAGAFFVRYRSPRGGSLLERAFSRGRRSALAFFRRGFAVAGPHRAGAVDLALDQVAGVGSVAGRARGGADGDAALDQTGRSGFAPSLTAGANVATHAPG